MPKLSGKADVATAASGDLVVLLQDQGDGTFEIRNLTRDGAANIPFVVGQSAHGFSVGDVVRWDGTGAFVAATADTEANARVVGVVSEVIDTDSFALKQTGEVTGASGLTADSVHYLQDAGGLGTSAGTVEVPILYATSTTSGWLLPLGAGGGGGGGGSSTESFVIAASDETTDLTTGAAAVTFRMPYAFTVTDVRASVGTAPAGSSIEVDVNEAGSSILSTVVSIDAGDKTSEDAGTQPVISDGAIAEDAEVTIDIDAVGSSTAGAGLKVYLIGEQA